MRLWTRWISLGVSAACFSWAGWFWLDQSLHQAAADELFRVAAAVPGVVEDQKASPVAKLEIPRLGVSGYVKAGLDATTLRQAIGHSPYSAQPGEKGNVVLAAHRDTFFAGLQYAQIGDIVTLHAANGKKFLYQVSKVFVVNPTDTWVMRSTPGRSLLTMITCYPFQFVGSAPNRLVVQAQPIMMASKLI